MNEQIVEIYAKKQLDKIFLSRLKTQDRVVDEANIIYPIRLIDRLFKASRNEEPIDNYGHNRLDGVLLEELEMMKLITIDGELLYRDLYLLIIYVDNSVQTEMTDGTKLRLYTNSLLEGDNPRPMTAKAIKDISIDHIVPMCKLLQSKELPAMKAISEIIRDAFNGDHISGQNAAKWTSKSFDYLSTKTGFNTEENRTKLLNEIKALNPSYRLMELRENIARNRRLSD